MGEGGVEGEDRVANKIPCASIFRKTIGVTVAVAIALLLGFGCVLLRCTFSCVARWACQLVLLHSAQPNPDEAGGGNRICRFRPEPELW